MWSIARRPRWIAALFLALGIAAGFAGLGQWQVSRSVADATVIARATEDVVPLSSLAKPQSPVRTASAGQMVSFDGTIVPGDLSVLSDRVNGGTRGYWVMAHVVVEDGASVAVALGWSKTRSGADAASATSASVLSSAPGTAVPFVGRYLASEAPQEGNFEAGERSTPSVAALINEWSKVPDGVYGGYVVSADAPAGLAAIDSPRPDDEVTLNWLNLFYAVEWAVFAVFAVFLWYRLVKDAFERETEEAAEAAEAADAAEVAEAGQAATEAAELRPN